MPVLQFFCSLILLIQNLSGNTSIGHVVVLSFLTIPMLLFKFLLIFRSVLMDGVILVKAKICQKTINRNKFFIIDIFQAFYNKTIKNLDFGLEIEVAVILLTGGSCTT